MQINFEKYVSLLQGLCSLNIYIGFRIDVICKQQVPSNTPSCCITDVIPIGIRHLHEGCNTGLPYILSMDSQNRTRNPHCFIHYCQTRLRRSVGESKTDMANTEEPSSRMNGKTNSLVRSTAFGNPSLPRSPPRKKKSRPPRTRPKGAG